MKSCVSTATFSSDPNKLWLYLTNPMLNHWRSEVTDCELSGDGMTLTEKNSDGTKTEIVYSRKEKPRRITCAFVRGKVKGSFTVILLGGGDSTSAECTLEVDGLGLFAKPKKLLDAYLDTLRKALGE